MGLTLFEEDLATSASTGRQLDATNGGDIDVSGGARWGPERTLRAGVIEDLISGGRPVHRSGLHVRGARILGTVDVSSARSIHPVSLVECYFDDPILAEGVELTWFSLNGSRVPVLHMERAKISRSIHLDGVRADGLWLTGATIGGQLTCVGAKISGRPSGDALSADGATVGDSILLDSFCATGRVRLSGTHVGGQLSCKRAVLTGAGDVALSADGSVVKGDVFFDEAEVSGEIRLFGADIGGELSGRGATMRRTDTDVFTAEEARIKGAVLFDKVLAATGRVSFRGASMDELLWSFEHFTGVLDLEGTTVNRLRDDWKAVPAPRRRALKGLGDHGKAPPEPAGGALLNGFRYGAFERGADDSVAARLAWIRFAPGYAAEPYTQLAAVYRRAGHQERARDVLIARETDARKRAPMTRWPRLKSVFLGATIAHGYKPGRAVLAVVVLVVALTALLGSRSGRQAMVATMLPTDRSAQNLPAAPTGVTCPRDYPCFDPLIYSAETVLPLVRLGQTEYWRPADARSRYQWFVWTATALGWLFATLAVAGLSGLIRDD